MIREVKPANPVDMVGIRQACLHTPFYANSYLGEFYSGTPPYPKGTIFVD